MTRSPDLAAIAAARNDVAGSLRQKWEIGLSPTAVEALQRSGFIDPLQLVGADLEKISRINGIGPKALERIREFVTRLGGE